MNKLCKLSPHSIYKRRGMEKYLKTDFLITKPILWLHRAVPAASPCGFIIDAVASVVRMPVKEFRRDYEFVLRVR